METEQFVLAFTPGEDRFTDHALDPRDRDQLLRQLEELDLAGGSEFETGSAGYGADTFTILVVLGSLSALFLSGKKIDENLEAWLKLGARLNSLTARLRQQFGQVNVSQPAALALAVEHIAATAAGLSGISVVHSHVVPVRNYSVDREKWLDFRHQPDRIYIFVLVTSENDTHVIGMRSNTEIMFSHRVPTGDWMEYFGVDRKRCLPSR